MDNATKNILVILSVLIIVAIGLTYYRTIIQKNYVVFPDEEVEEVPIYSEESIPFDAIIQLDVSPQENATSTP